MLRYRIGTEGAYRAAFYVRATAALNGSGEREAAAGFSARPIAKLPIVMAVEGRAFSRPGGSLRLRPAGFVYTEFPWVRLPFDMRGEVYGQAGYVGGNFATAFADGQARVDRRVVTIGGAEVRAGGGVWGGAQKDASRLDVGPTATVGLPLGPMGAARLGVDWRFRVRGNAIPASGPAVTLSAGF